MTRHGASIAGLIIALVLGLVGWATATVGAVAAFGAWVAIPSGAVLAIVAVLVPWEDALRAQPAEQPSMAPLDV